jgi:toxin-antitoxin system PIN domain toxin
VNLLDVNVLIALAWDGHEHHLPAHAWFGKNSPSGFATCNTTQSAFLRLSLNPDVVGSKLNIAEVLAQLESFTKHPSHKFWEDGALDTTASAWRTVTGHKQVMDTNLVLIAQRHGGKLVTFDGARQKRLPTGQQHLVEVIR